MSNKDQNEPQNPQDLLTKILTQQKEWSSKTFGTSERTEGILKHIEKEIEEVRKDPYDLTEWVDIVILALDGYWRHGGHPGTIGPDIWSKQMKNMRRKYKVEDENTPCEHIRED